MRFVCSRQVIISSLHGGVLWHIYHHDMHNFYPIDHRQFKCKSNRCIRMYLIRLHAEKTKQKNIKILPVDTCGCFHFKHCLLDQVVTVFGAKYNQIILYQQLPILYIMLGHFH